MRMWRSRNDVLRKHYHSLDLRRVAHVTQFLFSPGGKRGKKNWMNSDVSWSNLWLLHVEINWIWFGFSLTTACDFNMRALKSGCLDFLFVTTCFLLLLSVLHSVQTSTRPRDWALTVSVATLRRFCLTHVALQQLHLPLYFDAVLFCTNCKTFTCILALAYCFFFFLCTGLHAKLCRGTWKLLQVTVGHWENPLRCLWLNQLQQLRESESVVKLLIDN